MAELCEAIEDSFGVIGAEGLEAVVAVVAGAFLGGSAALELVNGARDTRYAGGSNKRTKGNEVRASLKLFT